MAAALQLPAADAVRPSRAAAAIPYPLCSWATWRAGRLTQPSGGSSLRSQTRCSPSGSACCRHCGWKRRQLRRLHPCCALSGPCLAFWPKTRRRYRQPRRSSRPGSGRSGLLPFVSAAAAKHRAVVPNCKLPARCCWPPTPLRLLWYLTSQPTQPLNRGWYLLKPNSMNECSCRRRHARQDTSSRDCVQGRQLSGGVDRSNRWMGNAGKRQGSELGSEAQERTTARGSSEQAVLLLHRGSTKAMQVWAGGSGRRAAPHTSDCMRHKLQRKCRHALGSGSNEDDDNFQQTNKSPCCSVSEQAAPLRSSSGS